MKENVGPEDRALRSLAGPALMLIGYRRLGGEHGHPAGLIAMIAGALVIESAITRVCPLNAMLGIDTGSARTPLLDRQAIRKRPS